MNAKERTAFLLENGICTTCGKEWAVKGRHSCLSCLDAYKVVYEQRKAKGYNYYTEHKAEMVAQHKAKRERYKKLGLCVTCGKKAIKGQTLCPICREKRNAGNRRRYHERKSQKAI